MLDIATRTFTRISGFPTKEVEVKGLKRIMGPSSISLGEGFAYVGNRCPAVRAPVSATTLTIGTCLEVPGPRWCSYVVASKSLGDDSTGPSQLLVHALEADAPSQGHPKLDGAPSVTRSTIPGPSSRTSRIRTERSSLT